MVLRYTAAANICLRCQYRIFASRNSRLPLTPCRPQASSNRYQHTQARIAKHRDDDENAIEGDFESSLRNTYIDYADGAADISYEAEDDVVQSSREPIADAHGFSGLSHAEEEQIEDVPRFKITRTYTGVPENSFEVYGKKKEGLDAMNEDSLSQQRLKAASRNRRHGLQGTFDKERIEDPKITSLGSPTEVILLRQRGIRYTHKLPRFEPRLTPEPVNILQRLNSERGLVDEKQVMENLDSLRPDVYHKLTDWDAFRAMEKQLSEGFSTSQLSRYIDSQKTAQLSPKALFESGEGLGGAKTDARVSAWMPGTSDDSNTFISSWLRGYIAEDSFTRKQKVVVLLMRQCWNLEVDEVTKQRGEVEIYLPIKTLDSLVVGREPALQRIANQYCESDEDQIEVFRGREAIRITANKELAMVIVGALKEAIGQVTDIEVDLNNVYEDPRHRASGSGATKLLPKLTERELEYLGTLTDTSVVRLSGNKLEISGVRNSHNRLQSSNFDAACRLLLPLPSDGRSAKLDTGMKMLDEPIRALRYSETSGLNWRDRLKHWARWTAGVAKRPASQLSSTEEVKELKIIKPSPARYDLKKGGIDHLQLNQTPDGGVVQDSIRWEHRMFTTSSIIVGHVLHESDGRDILVQPVDFAARRKKTAFLPATQNLAQLLRAQQLESSGQVSTLRMRFVPSPWKVDDDLDTKDTTFPPIDMRFFVDDETGDLRLADIVAVISSTTADVMLPDRSLDLRFKQRKTCRLKSLHNAQLPDVKDFLLASQLNLNQGPIVTPPSLTIPIAGHMYGQDSEVESTVPVEYMFAGLEYRQAFATSFDGWKMLYTSIDSGKAGGKRAELSLRPTRVIPSENINKNSPMADRMRRSNEFIAAAYKLVDALEEPTMRVKQRNSSAMSVRPLDEVDSWLKEKRTHRRASAKGAASVRTESDKTGENVFRHFEVPVFRVEDWLDERGRAELDLEMSTEANDAAASVKDQVSTTPHDSMAGIDSSPVLEGNAQQEDDLYAERS